MYNIGINFTINYSNYGKTIKMSRTTYLLNKTVVLVNFHVNSKSSELKSKYSPNSFYLYVVSYDKNSKHEGTHISSVNYFTFFGV